MQSSEALRSKRLDLAFVAVKLAALFAFLVLCAYIFSGGTAVRAVALMLLAFAPIGLYLASKWPLAFPFALYTFFVPLNDLLDLQHHVMHGTLNKTPFALYSFFAPLNDLLSSQQFGTLNKTLGAAAFVALTFWLIRNRAIIAPSRAPLAWLAVLVWMAMSGMWALDRSAWWELLPRGFELFALYLVVGLLPVNRFELRAIWLAIVAGGLAAAGINIFGFFQGNVVEHRVLLGPAGSGLVDPNHLAGSLLLPVCVTVAAVLSARSLLTKVGLMICLCVLAIGIYMTGSRDALLALVIAFLYFLWKAPHRRQIIGLIVLAALAAVPLFGHLAARLAEAGSEWDAGRLYIWHVGLRSLHNYWLLGAGLGNFSIPYYENYIHFYSRTPMDINYPRAGHSLVVTSVVELGIVGGVLMLVAWWYQFSTLKQIPRTNSLYLSRVALEASFLALFISSLFLDNMFYKYTWLVFCAMALLRSRYITTASEAAVAQNLRVERARPGMCALNRSDPRQKIPQP